MTIKELKQIIQKATYFNDKEKKELMDLFNVMNLNQANELAKIVSWAETQKKNFEFEKTLLTKAIAEIFTQMNITAYKETKKYISKSREEEENKKDKIQLENLLKDLNDI